MYPGLYLSFEPRSIAGSLASHYGSFDKSYCAAKCGEQCWALEFMETLLRDMRLTKEAKGILVMPWKQGQIHFSCAGLTEKKGCAFVLMLRFSKTFL